ncbi:hypothetical protein IJS18_02560 [Candidatus Saccharibacteria bacterium]|nr:hypothetical protein [Candidatus Saccharibacteria bacterium]
MKSVVCSVFTVIFVDRPNLTGIAAGQALGLSADGRTDVRSRSPRAVGGDLADAAAVLAEVPVRSALEIAVAFTSVDLHIVAAGAEIDFQGSRCTHNRTLLHKSNNLKKGCSFIIVSYVVIFVKYYSYGWCTKLDNQVFGA